MTDRSAPHSSEALIAKPGIDADSSARHSACIPRDPQPNAAAMMKAEEISDATSMLSRPNRQTHNPTTPAIATVQLPSSPDGAVQDLPWIIPLVPATAIVIPMMAKTAEPATGRTSMRTNAQIPAMLIAGTAL